MWPVPDMHGSAGDGGCGEEGSGVGQVWLDTPGPPADRPCRDGPFVGATGVHGYPGLGQHGDGHFDMRHAGQFPAGVADGDPVTEPSPGE